MGASPAYGRGAGLGPGRRFTPVKYPAILVAHGKDKSTRLVPLYKTAYAILTRVKVVLGCQPACSDFRAQQFLTNAARGKTVLGGKNPRSQEEIRKTEEAATIHHVRKDY